MELTCFRKNLRHFFVYDFSCSLILKQIENLTYLSKLDHQSLKYYDTSLPNDKSSSVYRYLPSRWGK